ncbi:MAG: hypothetical protein ACI9JK_001436 [Phycisphaerales bacterium]|jgi:hypothetical protein
MHFHGAEVPLLRVATLHLHTSIFYAPRGTIACKNRFFLQKKHPQQEMLRALVGVKMSSNYKI